MIPQDQKWSASDLLWHSQTGNTCVIWLLSSFSLVSVHHQEKSQRVAHAPLMGNFTSERLSHLIVTLYSVTFYSDILPTPHLNCVGLLLSLSF